MPTKKTPPFKSRMFIVKIPGFGRDASVEKFVEELKRLTGKKAGIYKYVQGVWRISYEEEDWPPYIRELLDKHHLREAPEPKKP